MKNFEGRWILCDFNPALVKKMMPEYHYKIGETIKEISEVRSYLWIVRMLMSIKVI